MTAEFVVALLVIGLLVGALARLAVPGPDPMPLWATVALGVGGFVVGGFVAQIFFGSTGSFMLAFFSALALLLAYRRFVQRRPITGPDARRAPR